MNTNYKTNSKVKNENIKSLQSEIIRECNIFFNKK